LPHVVHDTLSKSATYLLDLAFCRLRLADMISRGKHGVEHSIPRAACMSGTGKDRRCIGLRTRPLAYACAELFWIRGLTNIFGREQTHVMFLDKQACIISDNHNLGHFRHHDSFRFSFRKTITEPLHAVILLCPAPIAGALSDDARLTPVCRVHRA